MKKKLLSILLSIAIAITTFTSNVFADSIATVEDLLNEYGTYLLDTSNSFSNGNASLYILPAPGENYIAFNYNGDSEYAVVNNSISDIVVVESYNVYTAEGSDAITSPDVLSFQFIHNGYEITSIEVSGSSTSQINGTYVSPVPHKTIADILETVEGGYPVSSDDVTVPEGAWTTDDGYRLYYSRDKSKLSITDSIDIIPTMSLVKDSDNNYICIIDFINNIKINVKLVMNNSKLQRIEASAPAAGMEYIFAPLGNNRVTLDSLFYDLDTVPNSLDKAWVNENGAHIYIDSNDFIKYYEYDGGAYSSYSCLNKPNYSNSIKFADIIPSTITANMSNGKIQSLTVQMNDADIDSACDSITYLGDNEKVLFKNFKGTFSKPVTVEDLTSTIYDDDDFMFIKDESYKSTIFSNTLFIGGVNVGINNLLTKQGNDYSYTAPSTLPNQFTLTFKMSNNKLSSIVLSNSGDADGTYVPFDFQNPKTNYTVGYKGEIQLRLNAPFADRTGMMIMMDSNIVPLSEGTDYTVSDGSIKITLLSSYVETLTGPSHTLSVQLVNYPKRSIELTFTDSPSSGGGSGSSEHVVPNTGVTIKDLK